MDSFRNFVCVSNYMHLKSFVWKRNCPISSELQTSRIWPRSFNKTLKSSTSYIQSVKQAVYFLKAIEFWPTFDIQVDITLYFGKSCKTTPFRTPTETYQNTSTLISIALPIPKQQPCKNMRNLCFFGGSFFKWKNCWHLEFLMNQIFGQRFIVFKKNEV